MADFDAMARRPAAYLAETGVPQLSSGLIFFFLGSSVLIQRLLPRTPLYRIAGLWIGACCAITAMLAVAAIKRRAVFPRGGYVVPLGRTRRSLYLCISALIAGAIWVFVLAASGHRLDFLESRLVWPGFAITFSAICLYGGRQQKSASMICFGVYLACLAPLLWWLPVSAYEQSACLEVATGAPLAAAGAVRLRRFLRANPTPPESSE